MFDNSQSSLAQILQGGSQTLSSIMDRAIQVGRDISNKQLAQERDLLAMRSQETALQQRRAENLQQNIEDAQRFARNAYEFDTKFGADQAFRQQQQERQSAQDIFGNRMEEERLGVAKGGLQIRKDELAAERAATEAAAEKNRVLAGGTPSTSSATSPAVVSASPFSVADLYAPSKGPVVGNAAPVKTTTAPVGVSEAEVRFEAAKKTGDPTLISQRGAELDAAKAATPARPSSARPTDPALLEKRKLDLEEARRKRDETWATDFVKSNSTAFPASSGAAEQRLRKLAVQEGKSPADLLYTDKVGAEDRALLEEKAGGLTQDQIERAAVNRIDDIEQYVRLGGLRLRDADKELRRQFYRRVKGGAAPAAPSSESTDFMDTYR